MLENILKHGYSRLIRNLLETQFLAGKLTLAIIIAIVILPVTQLFAVTIPCGPEAKTQKDFNNMYLEWMQRHTVQPFKDSYPNDEDAIQFLNNICEAMVGLKSAPSWEELEEEGQAIIEDGNADAMINIWYGVSLYKTEKYEESWSVLESVIEDLKHYDYPNIQTFFAAVHLGRNKIRKDRDEIYENALNALVKSVVEGEFIDDEIRLAYPLINQKWNGFGKREEKFCKKLDSLPEADKWIVYMVEGKEDIKKAWDERGGGYANTVTEEGWKGFRKYLNQAREVLTKAWELNPGLPEAPVAMIKVAMAGYAGDGETEELWFERAVAAQMDYYEAYHNLLWALRPRWGGSHSKMIALGEACLETKRFDTDVPYFYLKSLLDIAGEKNDMNWRSVFREPGVYDNLKMMVEGYEKQEDRQDQERILSCKILIEAYCGNFEKATEILDENDPTLKISHGFYGSRIEYSFLDRGKILTEARAFAGPARDLLLEADSLSIAGDVEGAFANFDKALPLVQDDEAVRDYILNRIGFMMLRTETEEYDLGQSALHRAARKKQEEEEYEEPDPDDWEPLDNKLRYNPIAIAKYLLKNGMDVNILESRNWTPLVYASRHNNTEMVKLLIENGADLNLKTNTTRTALHYALRYEAPETADILINNGADLNARTDTNRTPLHYAARYGHFEAAKMLIEKGVNINPRQDDMWTPLHLALRNRAEDIALFLINNGANINARTDEEWTPLHFASRYKQLEAAKLLIEKGADINAEDDFNSVPLHLAIRYNAKKVAKYLIDQGADIEARTETDWAPIHYASHYNCVEIMKLLLEKGADPDVKQYRGWAPVHYAARYNRLEILELLIENGAELNAKQQGGWTAMHYASRNNRQKIIKLLIENDADINATTDDGWTPLQLAAHYNYPAIAEILVKAGADIDIELPDGRTAMSIAERKNNDEIITILFANDEEEIETF